MMSRKLLLFGCLLTLPVFVQAEATTETSQEVSTEATTQISTEATTSIEATTQEATDVKTGILNFKIETEYNLETTDIFRVTVENKNGEKEYLACDSATALNNVIDYELPEGEYTVDSVEYQGLNMDISTHVYGAEKSFKISDEETATLSLYINAKDIPKDAVLVNAENTEETSSETTTETTTEDSYTKLTEATTQEELSKDDIVESVTTEEEESEKLEYRKFPAYKFFFFLIVSAIVGFGSYIFYRRNM